MSLLRTLATVAIGVAAARGARALSDRANSGGAGSTSGRRTGGGGGLLDSLRQNTGGQRGTGSGGLGDLLGGGSGGRSGGGLGGLLEEFGGSGALGGLGGLLGGGAAGGALGGLLNGMAGRASGNQPDFGRRLNQSLATGGEPDDPPTQDEEVMAALMIRAMVMAAKADGRIDATEREALLGRLQDLDPGERAFVTEELNRDISVNAFARDVPDHPALKAQIFAAAMSAIEIDSAKEREFAEDLANALGIDERARGHVQRRMSDHYGDTPDQPFDETDNFGPYSQPIQAPAGSGGDGSGIKSTEVRPGQGRPYRK